eukprot:6189348-Pleurochrysis_carterae.AAC.1
MVQWPEGVALHHRVLPVILAVTIKISSCKDCPNLSKMLARYILVARGELGCPEGPKNVN